MTPMLPSIVSRTKLPTCMFSPFYTYNIASDGVIVNGLNVKEMSRKIMDEREMLARLGPDFSFALAHP